MKNYKLNPHSADGAFSHDTSSGMTQFHVNGDKLRYKVHGGLVVTPGSIYLRTPIGELYDDGEGNMLDEQGNVVGNVDYTAGVLSIDA